jgi:hypothetical protein
LKSSTENKGLLLLETILLTIVSLSGYCGDGHSCPGDQVLCVE